MIGSVMDGAPGKGRSDPIGGFGFPELDPKRRSERFFGSKKKKERESVCLCLCLCVSKHSSSIGDYMSAFARVLYLFFPV